MEFIIQLAAIVGVIGLLWLTLHTLRRFRAAPSSAARLQILQRVPVANGCHLLVVNWDGRELLIATGAQPCTLVAAKPANETSFPTEARSAWAQ